MREMQISGLTSPLDLSEVRFYLTIMNTQLSSKGQIVLPVELREVDQLTPGQVFEIERVGAGEYLLKRVREPGRPGLMQWLKECPSPDWFREVESESTDSLR